MSGRKIKKKSGNERGYERLVSNEREGIQQAGFPDESRGKTSPDDGRRLLSVHCHRTQTPLCSVHNSGITIVTNVSERITGPFLSVYCTSLQKTMSSFTFSVYWSMSNLMVDQRRVDVTHCALNSTIFGGGGGFKMKIPQCIRSIDVYQCIKCAEVSPGFPSLSSFCSPCWQIVFNSHMAINRRSLPQWKETEKGCD